MFAFAPYRNLCNYILKTTVQDRVKALKSAIDEDLWLLDHLDSDGPQVETRFRELQSQVDDDHHLVFDCCAANHKQEIPSQQDILAEESVCGLVSNGKWFDICVPFEPAIRAGIGFPLGFALVGIPLNRQTQWHLVHVRRDLETDCYVGRLVTAHVAHSSAVICTALFPDDLSEYAEPLLTLVDLSLLSESDPVVVTALKELRERLAPQPVFLPSLYPHAYGHSQLVVGGIAGDGAPTKLRVRFDDTETATRIKVSVDGILPTPFEFGIMLVGLFDVGTHAMQRKWWILPMPSGTANATMYFDDEGHRELVNSKQCEWRCILDSDAIIKNLRKPDVLVFKDHPKYKNNETFRDQIDRLLEKIGE